VEWGIKVEGSRLKVEGFDLCEILSPLIFSEGIFVFKNTDHFSFRLFTIKHLPVFYRKIGTGVGKKIKIIMILKASLL
jgi:hypothetical protein